MNYRENFRPFNNIYSVNLYMLYTFKMETSRNECIECLRLNIRQIKVHMEKLTSYEISNMFKDLKEVLQLYGFKKEDVLKLIDYSGTYEEYSDEELLEIEGVTNAVLFNLKYKM